MTTDARTEGSRPSSDADGAPPDAPTVGRRGLSWVRVVILVVACCWLTGVGTWYVVRDRPVAVESVDAGFYLDMIVHHEQAVTMALAELENGESPEILGFAQEIIIFQQYEIGRMEAGLEQWGISRADRGGTAMAWMDMPVPADEMPGMATEAQLQALDAARGTEADQMFLDLMTVHHRSGVEMAAHAADHADDPGVRELAGVMERNQTAEIAELAQAAERLGLDPPPGT